MYARKYVTCKLRRHFDQLQMSPLSLSRCPPLLIALKQKNRGPSYSSFPKP